MNKEELKRQIKLNSHLDYDKVEWRPASVYVPVVIDLIDQLDDADQSYKDGYDTGRMHAKEPERPVVPQFVADWIKRQLAYGYENVFIAMNRVMDGGSDRLINWFGSNPDTFARAWLDGYTMEKEQKYYVLDSEDIPLLERANNYTYKSTTALSIHEDGRDNSKFELTEKEIKDYDERFWPFAEEVTE